jgi:hypothetical protein
MVGLASEAINNSSNYIDQLLDSGKTEILSL